jgi:hypothetical protein
MSCWMRMVVVGVVGVSGLALGQTRVGPATVRIGEVGGNPSKSEDRASKASDIPASDKPAPEVAGDLTITQMRTMFLELEHPDGRVRERARERLMGLKRDDLKLLAKVVGEFSPLEDQMVVTIKEIVMHVYLSEDVYEKEEKGFLGITMPRPGDEDRMQVIVEGRMAGFGGFAALRDGDVIMDVLGQPLPQPLDREVFIDVIKAMRPGTTVKLKVLRQGTVRIVPVKVSARPAEKSAVNALAYEGKVAELLYRRGEEAEKFWKDNFGEAAGGKDLKTSASTTSN